MNLTLHHYLTARLTHHEYHLFCYLRLLPTPLHTSISAIARDCAMDTVNTGKRLKSLQQKGVIVCCQGMKAIVLEWVLSRPSEPIPEASIKYQRASRLVKVHHPAHGRHQFDEVQLYQFAAQWGLIPCHLQKVVDGDRAHHKEWRLAK